MPHHAASPGVRITRRTALHGSWSLPALFTLARVARASEDETSPEVASFLERWSSRVEEAVSAESGNDEALLFELCAELARIDPDGLPSRTLTTFEKNGVKSGPAHGAPPFLLIQFDLEPGASIAPHNHVGWSFLSLGLRGDATVRHFEATPDAPDPASDLETEFLVRQVSSTRLTRGRLSTLTRARANIHGFVAGDEGATFMDFGIHYAEPGEGPKTFSALEIEPRARDAARGLHAARWLGNIYAKSDSR